MYNFLLKDVKRRLGAKCSYLSFMQESEKDYFKAVVKNPLKGKDTVHVQIKDMKKLEKQDFDKLFEILNTGSFDTPTAEASRILSTRLD